MVQWLLAGIGDIARKRVIPAILREQRSALRAVVTSDPAKAEGLGAAVYADFDEALRHPGINAVYIATPVHLHHPQTLAALRAGKHVLCEKPTALDYAQAAEMARAAEESGLTCGIAYYRRTYPKVRQAQRLIAAGAIGKPVLAELHCHYWFNGEDGQGAWRIQKRFAGGGPLWDIASHRIDLCHFLFGDPVRTAGLRSNAVHRNDVEDNATVLLEHASGVRSIIDVRWHTRQERDECRIVGTDGALLMSPLNGPGLDTPQGPQLLPTDANLHYPLVEDFVDAVLTGRAPVCPIREAIKTDWVTGQIS
jgi:predicted dehydrogenase